MRLAPRAASIAVFGLAAASCKESPAVSDAFGALVLTTWDPVKSPMQSEMGGTNGEMLYIVLRPPKSGECLRERKLDALANGVAMKQVSAGGLRRKVRLDMHDSDLVHESCPPIAFGIAKRDLPQTPDGTVSFSLKGDGLSIDTEWSHVYAERKLELVDHGPELKVGERIVLKRSPESDAIESDKTGVAEGSGKTGVCLALGAEDVKGCGLKSPTERLCAEGTIEGSSVTFTVPPTFACAKAGTLRLERGTIATPALCDGRFEGCFTRYTAGQIKVTVSAQ